MSCKYWSSQTFAENGVWAMIYLFLYVLPSAYLRSAAFSQMCFTHVGTRVFQLSQKEFGD